LGWEDRAQKNKKTPLGGNLSRGEKKNSKSTWRVKIATGGGEKLPEKKVQIMAKVNQPYGTGDKRGQLSGGGFR